MSSEFFSKIECACGCECLLTAATAARGWRYIRGHKPQKVRTSARAERAPAPGPVLTLSPKAVLGFMQMQLEQLEKRKSELDLLLAQHNKIVDNLHDLQIACNRFEAFLGGGL